MKLFLKKKLFLFATIAYLHWLLKNNYPQQFNLFYLNLIIFANQVSPWLHWFLPLNTVNRRDRDDWLTLSACVHPLSNQNKNTDKWKCCKFSKFILRSCLLFLLTLLGWLPRSVLLPVCSFLRRILLGSIYWWTMLRLETISLLPWIFASFVVHGAICNDP